MTSLALIDLVLGIVVLEALLLTWLLTRAFAHVSRPALLSTLAAGATLLLALRAGTRGASAGELALWMTLALAAHLCDLRYRLAGPTRGDRHG